MGLVQPDMAPARHCRTKRCQPVRAPLAGRGAQQRRRGAGAAGRGQDVMPPLRDAAAGGRYGWRFNRSCWYDMTVTVFGIEANNRHGDVLTPGCDGGHAVLRTTRPPIDRPTAGGASFGGVAVGDAEPARLMLDQIDAVAPTPLTALAMRKLRCGARQRPDRPLDGGRTMLADGAPDRCAPRQKSGGGHACRAAARNRSDGHTKENTR
jgi:hypothetical protein